MTIDEFRKKNQNEDDWVPGWDEIESVFSKLYPEQSTAHHGTNMVRRAMFGGDQYLDGYSIYQSSKGYNHIVTFGMTELYADEDKLGGERNKWGYEMTFKLPANKENENHLWSLDLLANLARYTYEQKRIFEPYQFISGGGKSICKDKQSKITALMVISDTELESIEGIYGKVEFIQLVGITESELTALTSNPDNAKKLYTLIQQDNPDFVTDLSRVKSYM